jgi:hypothetical protein
MIHDYLRKAVQDDAHRAGERDRVLLEARRARTADRQHADPPALISRLTRMLFSRVTARPSVAVHSSNEVTSLRSWANSPGIEAAAPEA